MRNKMGMRQKGIILIKKLVPRCVRVFLARRVCADIDFSRPIVVYVSFPVSSELVQEIAHCMSPTSRLLLVDQAGECSADMECIIRSDERIEITQQAAYTPEELFRIFGAERIDVVL